MSISIHISIHVNPVVSDGQWTIGYDDDGRAGLWPGNMTSDCDEKDFIPATLDTEFSVGNETYTCDEHADEIYWVRPDGSWVSIRETLAAGGASDTDAPIPGGVEWGRL